MELRCSAIDSLRAVPPGLTEQYTERELRCMHAARSYLGHSHQTSFATAFRRHFGLRPKDVRRGKLD